MDYIVTGGAGYIGGHLVDRLISQKNSVLVLDDLSSGRYINKKARFAKVDLRRKVDTKNLRVYNPVIVHLAANPDVQKSMQDIEAHYHRDVTATLNTMEMARKLDAKSVVFSSTSAVYGNAAKIPTPEDSPISPESNYGMFKFLDEQIIKYYSDLHGIRAVSLRFANAAGGRASHGVIYNFTKMLKQNRPLEIWGNGRQRKSYVHITDFIMAIEVVSKKSKKPFDVFNVSNTDACSVLDIVSMLKSMGYEFTTRHIEAQEGDVKDMRLDIKKISELGWKPKHSSKESISIAINDLMQV